LPDLLLLDLNMPRRNGLEVVEWLRQRSGCRDLVTVILSSSQRENDVNKAYALGANAYLRKPSDYVDFLEMTRVLVSYWFRWAGRPRPNVSQDQRLRQETASLA
jgi:CheY-like chemotaxis protein